ncbi:toxin-antitoxin system YwqK family antitoxin [uncultured Gilliamella sp.]|uniref:toxin-antitoxin system YwqK family antitoxin n=1 Tax=uncultured Gilliamella sp. TaxID=1193505 RepID=UPI0025F10758|nr:toxin-antitoxin system YwqK family antitoxin [uncultured Gilliamella sp.]
MSLIMPIVISKRWFFNTVIVLVIALNIFSVQADDKNTVQFVSKINKIIESEPIFRRMLNGQLEHELADRLFFSDKIPCGGKYQAINARSVGLSQDEYYNSFWSSLLPAIQNEEYLLITSEACDTNKNIHFITNIQVCNADICDKKYLPANDIMWITDYENNYYPTIKKDADYFIKLPLVFDENKKLWKIEGWYFKDKEEKQLDKPVLAFEGYTSTDLMQKFDNIKFNNLLTYYYLSGNKLKEVPYNNNGEIDGIFISYYNSSDNNILEKVPFKNNKKEGQATIYNVNGTIEAQPKFYQDKNIDGPCLHYFANGQLSRQHTYLNGHYEGDYIDYFQNGQISEKSTYRNGKKVGVSEQFYKTGKPYSFTHYDDEGRLHGEYASFDKNGFKETNYIYEHGKTKERNNWKNGIKTEESFFYIDDNKQEFDGVHRVWYDNGQLKYIENYNKGIKEGLFQNWYPNGKLELEEVYKNNKLISSIQWNKDGIKKSEEFYNSDGLKEGEWKTWYDNGQLEDIYTYKDNKVDGLIQRWYQNGQLRQEAFYKQGKNEGVAKIWYENGKLASEKNYKDNVLSGSYTNWNEDGQIETIAEYDQGNLISQIFYRYNENNQKIAEVRKKYLGDKTVIEKIIFDEKGNIVSQTTE